MIEGLRIDDFIVFLTTSFMMFFCVASRFSGMRSKQDITHLMISGMRSKQDITQLMISGMRSKQDYISFLFFLQYVFGDCELAD